MDGAGLVSQTACRVCGGPTEPVLDLGLSPVANRLLPRADAPVDRHPLGLVECRACRLIQNVTVLPTAALFDADYPYRSSTSAAVRAGARDLAAGLAARVPRGARVLEIGCNDGAFLDAARAAGLAPMGLDPAAGAVAEAAGRGHAVRAIAFDASAAADLRREGHRFDAIALSNVLAHVPEPRQLLEAAADLLTGDGWIVAEVQSWTALVGAGAFDMVYHEHHCHFSLTSAVRLFAAAGLTVTEVETTPAQGGSLRLWARAGGGLPGTVRAALASEAPVLAGAGDRIRAARDRFTLSARAFARAASGRKVAGYGAAAKAVTLLSTCTDLPPLIAVADGCPAKQGRYLPAGGVPIVPPERLAETGAEVVLLFAWNLAREILPRLAGYEVWTPLPDFRRVQ